MLNWQKEHVRKNLTGLIQSTTWNAQLKAFLVSEGVLGDADVSKLEAIHQTKGTLEGSAELWGILPSRQNAYQKMARALIQCGQSGAARILEDGVWTRGFRNTKVMIHGKLIELQEILKIDCDDLQNNLADMISKSEEGIKCFVTGDNILELVKNTIPLSRPYYIERLISNNIKINPIIFKKECNDIFVLKGTDRIKLTELAHPNSTSWSSYQLLDITSRFVLLENDIDWEDMLKICKRPMHLIRVEDDSYILEETTGDSNVIREYFAPENLGERVFISEDELIEKIQKINYCSNVCICDTPGMGKSLLLASLARKVLQRYPERIVAFIPLANFISNEQNTSNHGSSSLKQVLNYLSPTELGRKILERAVTEEIIHLELFFDGFDEIPVDLLDLACRFFKSLTGVSQQIRVYIASRPQHQTELEKIMKVISYKIRPFSTENQIEFLASFWNLKFPKNDSTRLKIFASESVNQMKQKIPSEERDIMGIPLQCYLLAQVYLKEARIFSEPLRKIINKNTLKSIDNIFDMYDKFIQGKFSSEICFDRAEIFEYHVFKALQLICPEIADFFQFLNKISPDRYLSAGILEATNEMNSVVYNFVHRTFAEYFVGKFCSDIFTGTKCYNSFKCKNQDKMFELMFSRFLDLREDDDSFFYEDRFNFHYPVVTYFLNTQLGALTNISINPRIVNKLQDYFTHQKVYEFIHICVQHNYLSLIRLMILALASFDQVVAESYKKYFRKRSIMLGYNNDSFVVTSPLCHLLSKASNFLNFKNLVETFEVLCNFAEVSLSKVCRKIPINLDDPLKKGCQNADYDMVEYFVDKLSLENKQLISKIVDYSYLDEEEVIKRKIEICKLLLERNPELIFEENYGNDIYSTIEYTNVHLKIIKFLYMQGANLWSRRYDDIKIPIIVSARDYMSSADYHELVKILIQDKNVSRMLAANRNKSYFPLHKILNPWNMTKHELSAVTLQMLLNIPEISLDQVDNNNCNFLHAAVKGNQTIEIFEVLINRGVDYQAKDKQGQGVLHFAAEVGNLSTLNYFKSKGLSFNDRDIAGNSPFLLAKTSKVAKYFIEQGSDLYETNTNGSTIGHKAVLQMDRECFVKFFEYIDKYFDAKQLFNIKNNAGRTPLHTYIHDGSRRRKTTSVKLDYLLRIAMNDLNPVDELGNNYILSAVLNDWNHQLLQSLVKHGSNYEQKNWKSQNALQIAIINENLDTVNYLLSLGLSINTGYFSWNNPLLHTCSNVETIKLLIKNGAIPGSERSYYLKKNFANAAENVYGAEEFQELVLFLFEQCNGADVFDIHTLWNSLRIRFSKARDTSDETLNFLLNYIKNRDGNIICNVNQLFRIVDLYPASSLKIVKTLVANGADYTYMNKNGWSKLHEAVHKQNCDMVEYFLSLGLSPNEQDKKGRSAISELHFNYRTINMIECLLKYGTDISQTDNNGDNFVHKAAAKMTEKDFHDLTIFLLKTQDTMKLLKAKNLRGQTPLHKLLTNRENEVNVNTLKLILRLPGTNINEEDVEGFNYFLAAVKGYQTTEVLKKLVKWGCSYKAKNLFDNTALHISVNDRYPRTKYINSVRRVQNVKYIISLGINPNCKNSYGRTPLDIVEETLSRSRYESSRCQGQQSYEKFVVVQNHISEILKKGVNDYCDSKFLK